MEKNSMKQKMLIKSEAILRFLITDDEKLDTLIMCKSSEIELVTSDLAMHEAISSIRKDDSFRLNKLGKFFEVVKVVSHEDVTRNKKPALTEKRMEEIRKIALKKRE